MPAKQQPQQQQLKQLLYVIEQGLKKYSIEELSDAITQHLNRNEDRFLEINFVLSSVCDMYSISRHMLINSNNRGRIKEARNLAACMIHYDLQKTIRYVAHSVFGKRAHAAIYKSIKSFRSLNEKVKPDREFKEKYEILQQKLLAFINNNQQPKTHENNKTIGTEPGNEAAG